jgi:hypothetical protein
MVEKIFVAEMGQWVFGLMNQEFCNVLAQVSFFDRDKYFMVL